jgi:hypothetical protein
LQHAELALSVLVPWTLEESAIEVRPGFLLIAPPDGNLPEYRVSLGTEFLGECATRRPALPENSAVILTTYDAKDGRAGISFEAFIVCRIFLGCPSCR